MQPKKVILFCGSAGGLEVFINFVQSIGLQKDIAIVVLFHRSLSEEDFLGVVLKKYTEMNVCLVDNNTRLNAGEIYVAPGGYHLLLNSDLSFALDVSKRVNYCRPSADVALESFSYVLKNKLIVVIVSGSNHDGAAGAKIALDRAAKIIIQDPEEAAYQQMPLAVLNILGDNAIVQNSEKLFQTVLNLM